MFWGQCVTFDVFGWSAEGRMLSAELRGSRVDRVKLANSGQPMPVLIMPIFGHNRSRNESRMRVALIPRMPRTPAGC